MTQSRVCAFLRHPTELYTVAGGTIERKDPLNVDLCVWLDSHAVIPPALERRVSGGIDIRDGDCTRCRCFVPIVSPPIPTGDKT